MRKIVVTEFMTLDGVIAEPQNWSFPYWNDQIDQYKHDELFASDAQLLGRVTYEGFAASWPTRTGEFADFFNTGPKYVVSTTLAHADWNNSHIIYKNMADELKKLKQQQGKDILVHGSKTLVQTLIKENLVDEYHLLVYPLILGQGLRLLDTDTNAKLKLVESKPFSTGVVALTYQPA